MDRKRAQEILDAMEKLYFRFGDDLDELFPMLWFEVGNLANLIQQDKERFPAGAPKIWTPNNLMELWSVVKGTAISQNSTIKAACAVLAKDGLRLPKPSGGSLLRTRRPFEVKSEQAIRRAYNKANRLYSSANEDFQLAWAVYAEMIGETIGTDKDYGEVYRRIALEKGLVSKEQAKDELLYWTMRYQRHRSVQSLPADVEVGKKR